MKKTGVKKFSLIGVMVLVPILLFSIIVIGNDSKGEEQNTKRGKKSNIEEKQVYSKNKKGETYGEQNYYSEEEPDLIAVTATNGKKGYVRQSDIDKYAGGDVNSPEEAMEYQNNGEEVIKIPVYTKDGDEVIGYFELSGTSEEIKQETSLSF